MAEDVLKPLRDLAKQVNALGTQSDGASNAITLYGVPSELFFAVLAAENKKPQNEKGTKLYAFAVIAGVNFFLYSPNPKKRKK